jgi:transposase-like protein
MLEVGASLARAAQRHAVNANQIFHWRLYRKGLLCKKDGGSNLARNQINEVCRNVPR